MAISQISNAGIASAAGISTSKLGAGAVLQVVNATLTSPVTTTSTSMTSTGLTASITPSSSSNKILVYSSGIVSSSDGNQTLVQIVRNQPSANTRIDNQALNSSNSVYSIGIGDGYLSNRTRQTFAFKTLDAPATTNAITYTLNFMTSGSTAYLGRWGLDTNWNTPTCLVLMEIAA